jgi:hypothetical protein
VSVISAQAVKKLRADTVCRLSEIRQLTSDYNRDTVIDHIIACDSLLFGEQVTAHQGPVFSEGSPDRSGPLPAAKTEAFLSLVFANYTIVAAAKKNLEGYIDDFHARRRGVDMPGPPHQLSEWQALADRTSAALKELSEARFEAAKLEGVTACWPELQSAIIDARNSYGTVSNPDLRKHLNRSEKIFLAAFALALILLATITGRLL